MYCRAVYNVYLWPQDVTPKESNEKFGVLYFKRMRQEAGP